jgi:hypothetical protein
MSFAEPVHNALGELLDIHDMTLEKRKELKTHEFFLSYRQECIALAEEFAKRRYGNDFFARSLVSRIKKYKRRNFTIADLGFEIEMETLLDNFKPEEMVLIQLSRKGYDWGDDSRTYIDGGPDVTTVKLENCGTEAFIEKIIGIGNLFSSR